MVVDRTVGGDLQWLTRTHEGGQDTQDDIIPISNNRLFNSSLHCYVMHIVSWQAVVVDKVPVVHMHADRIRVSLPPSLEPDISRTETTS